MMRTDKPVRAVLAEREMELGPTGAADKAFRHWSMKIDGERIAWLILDREGESANTLSRDVIEELSAMIAAADAARPKGLVIRSAKKAGFAAGADIREFRSVTEASQVREQLTEAHKVIDRLEDLPFPTVAVVHGHCLGGGLELALACRFRIAVEGAKLGFPEVMLGLHPGLGGTYRLPALIDPLEAMTMMLTGKSVHDRKAKALGLVDVVVPERHVDAAVRAAIRGELETSRGSWKGKAFSLKPARALAARQMRAKAAKQAPEANYPAPHRLIDLWEDFGGDADDMQRAEIASFSELLAGRAAQNLIRVFFLREGLRALGRKPFDVAHVHVVGAGTMGADIAAWCARQGKTVTISDIDPKALARAIGRAAAFYDKALHSGIERRDALDRLIPDFTGDGIARADVIIEAVAEKTEIKRKVLSDIGQRMKPGALVGTNTSSIPLEGLADALPDPKRLVGLHFFNPVTRLELVEVVRHEGADGDALEDAYSFCRSIARLPAPVRSAPGFLVNRVLTPYLAEAFLLMDEGVAKETIDHAAERFGMPMGPIELADRVGLDIGLSVADMLRERLDDPMPEVPAWLRAKVENGELGRKTGKGLYEYDSDGRPKKSKDPATVDNEMIDRLILPMVNTAMRCLREGVVADADTLDAAMIFATGFAPFTGGPMRYAEQRGHDDIERKLERLAEKHGQRFAPDPGWKVAPKA